MADGQTPATSGLTDPNLKRQVEEYFEMVGDAAAKHIKEECDKECNPAGPDGFDGCYKWCIIDTAPTIGVPPPPSDW
ncbi:hypothetical protein O0I10_011753 [Lichtheimia ornata]|uniref:Uncharacterized protein n=1 Tax=Lichtheimia ornata TaxID=688661 RepID=A0AAD7UTZ7_9FUNG|nr:uncharacterized protein O0I10_011753 [Lichtheimia ornata]KAJ8652607.1 hypothetical protein O0I10_011753 [Lichtheimia ornata]